MADPLHVSVVTPTFNRPAMLAHALQSLQAQTYPHFDVLVADNANDPKVRQLVEALADSRFTYLGRPRNIGLFDNAVDALRRATGDLVFKLDDDDSLEPACFQWLVQPFTEFDDVTLTFCELTIVNEHDEVMPRYTQMYDDEFGKSGLDAGLHRPFTDLAARCAILLACSMVRRDAVDWDRITPAAGTSYDLNVTLDAARNDAAAYFIPQRLVNYRVHTASDTRLHARQQLSAAVHVLEEARADPRHHNQDALRRALRDALVQLGRQDLRESHPGEARQVLLRATALGPTVKTMQLLALSSIPGPVTAKLLDRRFTRYQDRLSQRS